ncbi:cytosolic carboxypeptidase-like protein 5 isoform 2-T3 [Synchiropus picturatus]
MEVCFGKVVFSSKFESGNLARVEKVEKLINDCASLRSNLLPELEFNVWVKPDCEGTEYENGNRSWFYFSVRGVLPGKLMKINVMNMNNQRILYNQGMAPLVRTVPGKECWERIRDRPTCETIDDAFVLSFMHRTSEIRGATTYFSFCYPFSYTECQEMLQQLGERFSHISRLSPTSPPNEVYYHRELLCHSLDGNRVDLITVTNCSGMQDQREPRLARLFPDSDTARPHCFSGKKVFFLSSRVHPGETPSSFVFNGFLNFILRTDDPRAHMLRNMFVFKLIPMLNPDGVIRGHYRTDSRGVNLNRQYLNPSPELHPSIYAAKTLLLYYHTHYLSNASFGGPPSDSPEQRETPPLNAKPVQNQSPQLTALEESLNQRNSDGPDSSETEVSMAMEENDWLTTEFEKEEQRSQSFSDTPDSVTIEVAETHGEEPESIKIQEGGVAYYVDLHGHASKRGCFMYGNNLPNEVQQVENMLFPKLISLNSAHFDFSGCNFTEKNMYARDRKGGLSKEGSGRVAIHKAIGLLHSYTLECNYNTGKSMNIIPPACHDNGRATPPPPSSLPPKYTPDIYNQVGSAVAVSALDMEECNPWPRLVLSEHNCLTNLRAVILKHLRNNKALNSHGNSNPSPRMNSHGSKASPPKTLTRCLTGSASENTISRVRCHSHSSSSQTPSPKMHSSPSFTFGCPPPRTQQNGTHTNGRGNKMSVKDSKPQEKRRAPHYRTILRSPGNSHAPTRPPVSPPSSSSSSSSVYAASSCPLPASVSMTGNSCPDFQAGGLKPTVWPGTSFPMRPPRVGKVARNLKNMHQPAKETAKELGPEHILSSVKFSKCDLQPYSSRIPVRRAGSLDTTSTPGSKPLIGRKQLPCKGEATMRVWKLLRPGLHHHLTLTGTSIKEAAKKQGPKVATMTSEGSFHYYENDGINPAAEEEEKLQQVVETPLLPMAEQVSA